MKITIDRIEENIVCAELPDGTMCNVPIAIFGECREGDIFNIEKDSDAMEIQKEKIDALMNELFE